MFARFDENPAMTLQDIKKKKRYGRTDGRTDGQRENSIPTTNKVCGGYNELMATRKWSKETKTDFIVRILSSEHFNFKRYSIEREVIWINTILTILLNMSG